MINHLVDFLIKENLYMQELLDRGERCAVCGEMHFPEDLTQGVCGSCLVSIVINQAVEAEEAALEARAAFCKYISLVKGYEEGLHE